MFKNKEDRLAYDREHNKKLYLQYKLDRKKVLDYYGNCCYCCSATHRQLHLHHKYYDEHSNYPRTSSGWSRIKRVQEALQFPDKFRLLCNRCHRLITMAQSIFNDKHLQIIRETQPINPIPSSP